MTKRLFDIFAAGIGILLLSPFFLIIAWLIRRNIGSPVFFYQTRPGLDGLPFRMVKFRSMIDTKDSAGNLLPDEIRITTLGRFLRASSLDELPELWNVLKGDMSLVGPRPLLMEYLSLYTPEQARRHKVRPGITGWAQVNGRNSIGWEERFKLDIWYVNHQSFWLDIKILWMTISPVLSRSGINQKGHLTVEKFRGKNTQEVN